MLPNVKKIPLEQCEDRRLYRIFSRNLSFGVFRKETGGFIGIREKWGDLYLFEEYHWDNGPPFGTVNPQEALELLPPEIANSAYVEPESICQTCLKGVEWKPDPVTHTGPWVHLEPTDCLKPLAMTNSNEALFKWLEAMEAQYAAAK